MTSFASSALLPAAPAAGPAPSYRDLLYQACERVPCDAAALLRLEGGALVPVATEGLSEEAMGRRFQPSAHPRFERLLASPDGLRFDAACDMPDPYDGLVAGHPEILPVHDCMGVALRVSGELWGLLTFDALTPGAFEAIGPASMHEIARTVERGLESAQPVPAGDTRRGRGMAAASGWRVQPRELLGTSSAMQTLRREIDTVAASDLTVLLLGETGAGKDLAAQRLHAKSHRSDQPLVQVNCAALPETLADSELFGHKRGAFTGAVQDRAGKFELADGGTLFLDEVAELPLTVQAKLLRVLQSGEVQRPGSDRTIKVDVRVIAATNRDLRESVAQGRFRADLYHRLSVYPVHLPPLRQRGRDVLTLVGGFLEENQHRLAARNLRLAPAAKAAILAHDWPGNVRELDHAISRAALRAVSEQGRGSRWTAIEPRHLGLESSTRSAAVPTADGRLAGLGLPAHDAEVLLATQGLGLREATEAFQRRWVDAALTRHGGRISRAARDAGMDRSNFLRLLRRLDFQPTSAGEPATDDVG